MARSVVSIVLLTSLAGGLAGCSSAPRIEIDGPGDLTAYRTWALVGPEAAGDAEPIALQGQHAVEKRVARSLAARGLTRVSHEPDLWAVVGVVVRRHRVRVNVPMAPYLLSSMSSDASFLVEGSRQEERDVRDVHVALELREPSGHRVWRGELAERLDDASNERIGEVAEALLAHIPQTGSPAATPRDPLDMPAASPITVAADR